MIVITGATGSLGRQITDQLLTMLPATEIGVSVRDPNRAGDLRDRGVRVRRGDFADPSSLPSAFEGATQVLVVSANATGEAAVRLNSAAVHAAAAAGAGRVLYTSHMGADPRSAFPPMRTHAVTERVMADCGIPWTSLRNGFYASSAIQQLRPALQSGELALPADAAFAWTAHTDLADAAVAVLTGNPIDGATAALTGSEELDMAALAAIASEVTGHPIRRVVVDDDEFHDRLIARGTPPPIAELALGMFVASRRGAFAPADPTLARLVGHRPVPFRQVLQDALAAGS